MANPNMHDMTGNVDEYNSAIITMPPKGNVTDYVCNLKFSC